MVTALGLYCDLLEEPGVLATPFAHYGNELRLVAAASRRLVEKLVTLEGSRETSSPIGPNPAGFNTRPALSSGTHPDLVSNTNLNTNLDLSAAGRRAARAANSAAAGRSSAAAGFCSLLERGRAESRQHETAGRWDLMPAAPIENLAAELLANHNLLAALAGPTIAMTVDVEDGVRPVRLTGEDLTRVLVNMVKNAAEAMPDGGRIQFELHELPAAAGGVETLELTIEDNGPGIPEGAQEEIFASGYTTRAKGTEARGSWPVIHRGLGLSITRSIVESAGGRIVAANRAKSGARFAIELPVRSAR
jgi:signal transduction histidine kinase